MMVQVECLHTVLFPKALYRPTLRCRQVWRPPHILEAPGGVLFYCSSKFQYLHGSWFLVVHALCLGGAGWSWPAWDHFICQVWGGQPGLLWVDWFMLFWWQVMQAFQSTFGQASAGNSLCSCGTGVGWSTGSPPSTKFSSSACSRYF